MTSDDSFLNKSIRYVKSSLPLVYLIVALLALRYTIVEPYVVPTGSMEPTLKTGDRLYALKCAYDLRFPFTDWILFRHGQVKHGDVILFRAPHDPDITYVKRAIGLPGDRIEFRDGTLYLNGKPVLKDTAPNREVMYDIERREDKTLFVEQLKQVKHYVILDNGRSNHRNFPEVIVPENSLFAVGDNRDNSSDSRVWLWVPMENLKGKAMFIWFSSWDFNAQSRRFNQFFDFITGKIRLERIGTLIQ